MRFIRTTVIVLAALSLTGCSTFLGASKADEQRADDLGVRINELPGVEEAWASYSVGFDIGDNLVVSVEPDATIDAAGLVTLAALVEEQVRDSGFNGSQRVVRFDLEKDSELVWTVSGDDEFSVLPETEFFARWWADRRVATIENEYVVLVTLVPGQSVRSMYEEIVADSTEFSVDRHLRVDGPGEYMLIADRAVFTDAQLDMAEEIAALTELNGCSFSQSTDYDGVSSSAVYCTVSTLTAAAVGDSVNAIVDAHGQLESTKVELYDGDWVTTNDVN